MSNFRWRWTTIQDKYPSDDLLVGFALSMVGLANMNGWKHAALAEKARACVDHDRKCAEIAKSRRNING